MVCHMSAQTDTTAPRIAYAVPESARMLGISRRGLYRLIEDGTLRTVTLGRRRLVPADELSRLIQPREVAA